MVPEVPQSHPHIPLDSPKVEARVPEDVLIEHPPLLEFQGF
jgi:hypothetical protein